MLTWDQSAGTIALNGRILAKGYSGKDWAKNNPDAQAAKGMGPIPRGQWKLTGIYTSKNTGPLTIVLVPMPGTDALGRSEFRIHGDSREHPGTASRGCIILPPNIRAKIWDSGERILTVTE